MTSPERKHLENLAAPCGLYCGACMLYRASHEKDTTNGLRPHRRREHETRHRTRQRPCFGDRIEDLGCRRDEATGDKHSAVIKSGRNVVLADKGEIRSPGPHPGDRIEYLNGLVPGNQHPTVLEDC